MAKSTSSRQHFVKTAVELITQYNAFDGIDIDWEFPGGGGNSHPILMGEEALQKTAAFRLMMKEFHYALDILALTTKRQYQLTAAVNGSVAKVDKSRR